VENLVSSGCQKNGASALKCLINGAYVSERLWYLLGVDVEHFGGGGAGHCYKAAGVHSATRNTARPDEGQAFLNTIRSMRNETEVVSAECLLLGVKCAVGGANHLQIVTERRLRTGSKIPRDKVKGCLKLKPEEQFSCGHVPLDTYSTYKCLASVYAVDLLTDGKRICSRLTNGWEAYM